MSHQSLSSTPAPPDPVDPTAVLACVAHEMRTPLTALIQALTILEAGRAGALGPNQARFVRMGIKNAETLLGLTLRIQDYARWEAGGTRVSFAPFDAIGAARFVVDALAALAQSRGVDLGLVSRPDVPLGWGDDELVRGLLFNLIGNALKFTPSGGAVTVDVRRDHEDPRRLEVTVTDTGSGIQPGHEELIFTKYYQTSASHETRKAGTGLGLAISREIVRAHGGSIRAEGVVGGGSVFTLHLPAFGSGLAAGIQVRRLVDEAGGAPVVCAALDVRGMDLAAAHAALLALGGKPPDVAIVDLGAERLALTWRAAADGRNDAWLDDSLAAAGLDAVTGWCTHPAGAPDDVALLARARGALDSALRDGSAVACA